MFFILQILSFSPIGLSELILGAMPTEIHTKGSPDNTYLSIKYFRFSGHYLYAGSLKCPCRLNQSACVLLEERTLRGTY